MNIQIFGKNKCFDTKKAERYFKERRIQVQFVDMGKKAPSKKEVQLFLQQLGNPGAFDTESKLYQGHIVRFTSRTEAIIEAVMEEPQLLKTPIVRNGQKVTAGFCPDIWKDWQ